MVSMVPRTVLVAANSMLDATSTDVGSVETSLDLLNDRISLMAATTLLGFTCGIIFVLYCLVTYSLLKKLFWCKARSGSHSQPFPRSQTRWRKYLFYLTYTSVLFVLALLYTAGNSRNAIVAYVENRLYPAGPYQYYITFMIGETVMVMIDVASTLILWMTDGLILCRFIIIYYNIGHAWWIIPLPCAMYVAVVVLSALILQGEASFGRIYYLSENLLLAYYVLSFSLSVVSTVLIAARLYWHTVQIERVLGPRVEAPYMNLAATLIESAAIYGIWSLAFLTLYILQSPGLGIVLAMAPHVQAIAPLLIILWIARGNAWKHGRDYSSGEVAISEAPVQLSSGGGAERFSYGARPATRVAGRLCGDVLDVHPGASRNTSQSTIGHGDGDGGEDGNSGVNVIELGLYSSKPSSVIYVIGDKADALGRGDHDKD